MNRSSRESTCMASSRLISGVPSGRRSTGGVSGRRTVAMVRRTLPRANSFCSIGDAACRVNGAFAMHSAIFRALRSRPQTYIIRVDPPLDFTRGRLSAANEAMPNTYQTAVEDLYALGHELANTPSEHFNLAYMRAILRELGDPQR